MKVVSALAPLVLFLAAVDAWTITSTDASAPASSLGEHLDLVKYWTIAGDKPLNALELRFTGPVFVDYDEKVSTSTSDAAAAASTPTGERVVARVAIQGDSRELLDAIEVVEQKDDKVKIHFKNQKLDVTGYLRTRVFVGEKQELVHLSNAGSESVIVGENVFLQNDASKSIQIDTVGSGDVLVATKNEDFSLQSLALSVAGSGDVQFQTKSLTIADTIDLTVTGSGDLGIVADKVHATKTLSTSVAGSGNAYVQADEVVSSTLETTIVGSGDVTFSRGGSCEKQSISLAGAGNLAAGSIVCVDTDVSVIGAGDIVVQTTNNLTVAVMSSGSVKYVNDKPKNVEVSGFFFRHSKKDAVKPADKNEYEEFPVLSPPEAKAARVEVHLSRSYFSSEPSDHGSIYISWNDDGKDNDDDDWRVATQRLAVHVSQSPHTTAVVAFAGVAFVAVGVAAYKYRQRRVRQQYQPLL
ncbi:hypothetical protein Poli38472_010843 [Pythium oligandrum]|uniref:Putative auto-transporter adhesin head GIN domain-containing protein n=1 Tax=Pythium oligandrum TaxID=41045 RepID=A0A8K1CEL7_PYTOL|nr:hypothetical protein Poli38472_010843 [Pythium oligandrum]|eukprot:TMW61780.1 hypothetical protein Poli38472_010843 [Pythium oligandrum]